MTAVRRLGLLTVATILGVSVAAVSTGPAHAAESAEIPAIQRILPTPVSITEKSGKPFVLTDDTRITLGSRPSRQTSGVGYALAGLLRPATGLDIPVVRGNGGRNQIHLELGGPTKLGDEGYELTVKQQSIVLRARTAAGLFHGVQTIRQLLPAAIESSEVSHDVRWAIPRVSLLDYPRLAIRATMLDVSRHFLTVAEVKKYIDAVAPYKLNTLELHLADDQGWRLWINSWPRLAGYGGSTEVGGTPGGYYTQQDYAEIVRYAEAHFLTVVPEIDTPGHTNAALASYAELNCDGKAPPLYTGVDVGFSSLCLGKPITYHFLDDVVREIAAITPGPYISLGGDEAASTSPADYLALMARAQKIVLKYGKTLWGWHQIAASDLKPGSVAAYWGLAGSDEDIALAKEAVAKGQRLVLAPADHAYLDMKYADDSPFGQDWAGLVSVTEAYNWDPSTLIPGVGGKDVAGVLAPVWTETMTDISEVEFMAFPRLAGMAEIGWSPKSTHDYAAYSKRLAAQGPRWTAAGVNFFRAPDVPWL
jgi:hexosaminidase